MDFHPPFLTLLQMPKHVSKMIDRTAIIISGFTGVKIVNNEKRRIDNLDFILPVL
jgi:hypothetical protein